VLNSILPHFEGKVDVRTTYRWELERNAERHAIPIPDRLPWCCKLKIGATVTSTRNRTKLAQLGFGDVPFYLQIRVGTPVADLNRTVKEFLNERGQGGDFRVEEEESDMLDFNRPCSENVHRVRHRPLFIKQTKFIGEENERRFNVS
jgi:hypothetical protein